MTDDATRLEDDAPVEEDRTRLEGSDPGRTVLEGGASKRSESLGLVGRTFEGTEKSYLVLEELEASGAEADVYVVEEQDSEDRRVLKYYRRGIRPKAEITEMLAGLEKEHVVQVYETGVKDGRSYEIQEFVEHGSLADMVTSGGLPDDRMKEILHELLIAAEHLHERNVIHRDLKPANVLVRTIDPLDLVFIDFGIASQTEHSLHATSASRTVSYASPEALTGVVAKASDWWSVGVMLLELLTGKHPFSGLNEQAVNFQLVSKGIEVPSGIAGDWQLLLKGLLTRDREKRWGAMQVRKWLEGERSMATGYDVQHAEELETKKYDYKPYKFAGDEYYEPSSLAKALAENWNNGAKNLGRGFVADWVKDQVGNQELAGAIMDVSEDESLDADQRLSVVLMVLDPSLPLLDEEGVLSRESLPSRASGLAGILKSGLGRWLKDLRGDDWLLELGKEYQEFGQEIDKFRKHLDETLANQLFLLAEEELEGKWSELRREYGGCTVSVLNQVFKVENPMRTSKISLLSVKRELLLTHEEVRQETLRSSLGDYLEHLDEQKAFELDLLDEEELESKWSELRREYGGCKVSRLNQSFKAENPTRIDKIALFSLRRELLLTHEQVRHETALEGEAFTIRDLTLEMLWCAPGTFTMGSPLNEAARYSDETQHAVTLTHGFWLGKHHVTQAQWELVMDSNPSAFKGANLPVETVSWSDVVSFCNKLTERERRAGRLPEGYAYQLPTEAQWEYACRAGTKTAFAFGDSLSSKQANFDGNHPYGGAAKGVHPANTAPVGSYPANAWGFHDMHGNVWEWCHDWYGDYPSGTVRDPVGSVVGSERVDRGGSWCHRAWELRSARRYRCVPAISYSTLGFRLSLRPASK